jgi:hypothetical protein
MIDKDLQEVSKFIPLELVKGLSTTNNSFCDLCEFEKNQGIYYCRKCFQNRKLNIESWEIDKITDKVFLGNEEGGLNKEKLKELGVTHVLICGLDLHKFHPEEFTYKHFLIDDHPNEDLKKYFREALMFMDSSKKVYVHCWAGVSRSASIVIAYIMWKKKLNYEEAHSFVKERREWINPNEGFISQLKEFEENLRDNDYKLSKPSKKKNK